MALAIKQGDRGIDVSRYQTFSNFGDVAKSGVKFGWVKATEGSAAGTAYVSSTMDSEFNGLKGAGIEAGFYHFARYVSVSDALAEAEWFVSHIKNYDFTLPPALDLEYNGCGSVTVLGEATAAFLKYVEDQLGSAIIYLSASYYNYVKDYVKGYGIWLADPSNSINIPVSESELFAWQQNWHGQIAGISGEVDLDVACGNFFTVVNKLKAPSTTVTIAPVLAPAPAAPVKSAPVVVKPSAPSVPSTYTVHGGDTVSGIAAKFGLTISEIENLNHINTKTDEIFIGQVLKLKANAPAPVHHITPPKDLTYTIKSGDSIDAIAAKFGVSASEIEKLNNITHPNLIQIGQVLILKKGGSGTGAVYHTVVSGDSVSALATKYGSTETEIKDWNHLSNVNDIQIGQRLRVK